MRFPRLRTGIGFLVLTGVVASGAVIACGTGSGGLPPPTVTTSADGATSVTLKGCSDPNGAATAPDGYYTSGATVCTAAGEPHLFHGVDRPSLEFSSTGANIGYADFANMASWNANVVRVALNQDYWLSKAALYDPTYQATVVGAVHDAEAAGLDVILDLHWSDQGDLTVISSTNQGAGYSNQQPMADVNSKEFWSEVAAVFKDDGHVLFELYNEPHDVPTNTWLNGGMYMGFEVVGMQQLYDTVRGVGANNVVVVGGLDWAYSLGMVRQSPVNGFNIMYATHPYDKSDDQPATWDTSFGFLSSYDIAPVIATEFGDGRTACTGAWDQNVIHYADQHQMSWTAWAWYPAGCQFPALISDWDGTTTVQGDIVKAALLAYPANPRPDAGPPDAGSDAASDAPSDGALPEAGDAAPASDATATTDSAATDSATDNDAANAAADAADSSTADTAPPSTGDDAATD